MLEHSVAGGSDNRARLERVVDADGTESWFLNGQLHREDGPAVVRADGDREWFLNGQIHREDGPAFEGYDGFRAWYMEGLLHREDGPAFERTDGSKEWYANGQIHREDGPAVVWLNGDQEWWILDCRVDEVTVVAYAKLPPSGKGAVRALVDAGADIADALAAASELEPE